MRGEDPKQEAMFSYVSPEQRVPQDHPLRPIREMVDTILQEMSPRFARLYKKSKGAEAKLSYLGHVLYGEPQRVAGPDDGDAGRWNGGARCRLADGLEDS